MSNQTNDTLGFLVILGAVFAVIFYGYQAEAKKNAPCQNVVFTVSSSPTSCPDVRQTMRTAWYNSTTFSSSAGSVHLM